jgi:hypothetical protein
LLFKANIEKSGECIEKFSSDVAPRNVKTRGFPFFKGINYSLKW